MIWQNLRTLGGVIRKDIFGPTGPTEIVHLSELTEFNEAGNQCQYSWVSQQWNPREMQGKSSVGFQQGNSDTWFSCWKPSVDFPVETLQLLWRFPDLGKVATQGICRFSWGRKSNNSEIFSKLSVFRMSFKILVYTNHGGACVTTQFLFK